MSTFTARIPLSVAPQARLRPPLLIVLLLGVNLMLGLLYLGITEASRYRQFHFFYRLLDLDREGNLPSWYSATQLFGSALLTAVLAWYFVRRMDRRSWVLLLPPAMFLFLSVDEAASIHEWLGHKIEDAVPAIERKQHSFSRTGLWMVALAPPLLLAGALLARAAWRYLRVAPEAIGLYATGLLLLVLAAGGGDFLSNYVAVGSRLFFLTTFVEEIGEMTGGTLLLWASIRLLQAHRLRVTGPLEPEQS